MSIIVLDELPKVLSPGQRLIGLDLGVKNYWDRAHRYSSHRGYSAHDAKAWQIYEGCGHSGSLIARTWRRRSDCRLAAEHGRIGRTFGAIGAGIRPELRCDQRLSSRAGGRAAFNCRRDTDIAGGRCLPAASKGRHRQIGSGLCVAGCAGPIALSLPADLIKAR